MKKIYSDQDTIAAISTPPGTGGIAVIRVSGERALQIAKAVFQFQSGHESGTAAPQPRYAHAGNIVSSGNQSVIDTGILIYFKAPHSYTGEDVAEISCHGGILVQEKVLEACLNAGCRAAQPGEFTRRAFVNKKLDLIQAESVAQMIHAKSETALAAARTRMLGGFSQKLKHIKNSVEKILALVEVSIDFSTEDIDFTGNNELIKELDTIIIYLDQTVKSSKNANLVQSGIKVVIAGMANVGKSSIINELTGIKRSIVHKTPGTTRDYIEQSDQIQGMWVRFVDTAGIGKYRSAVDNLAVRETQKIIRSADLAVLVYDSSKPFKALTNLISIEKSCQIIHVANKIDLRPSSRFINSFDSLPEPRIKVSALKHKNVQILRREIGRILLRKMNPSQDMLTLPVQRRAAAAAVRELKRARGNMKNQVGAEIVSCDLRQALGHLGEIVGETYMEKILSAIFSRFCVGK